MDRMIHIPEIIRVARDIGGLYENVRVIQMPAHAGRHPLVVFTPVIDKAQSGRHAVVIG